MWHDIVRCLNGSSPKDIVRQCPCYSAEGESNWAQRRKRKAFPFLHQRMVQHFRATVIE